LRVENLLFQLGAVAAVWWLTRELFGRTPALVAAAVAAILPGMWTMSPLIAKENLAMLLLPLVSVLTLRITASRNALAFGLVAAALAMVRQNFISYLAILLVIVGVAAIKRRAPMLIGWYGLGVVLVFVPIVTLNLINDGPPLPTAVASFQTWAVNNERATGGYFSPDSTKDNPFRGISDWDVLLDAQRKLGIQFIVANPFASAKNVLTRHQRQWRTDSAGIRWTYFDADENLQNRVPLDGNQIRHLTEWSFMILLLLAAIGAFRGGMSPGVGLALILPLAWGLATLAVAEGNYRYHVTYEPLLCVLAGAAFFNDPVHGRGSLAARAKSFLAHVERETAQHRKDAVLIAIGALCVAGASVSLGLWKPFAFWDWPGSEAMSWLILFVLAVLAVRSFQQWGPPGVRWLGSATSRRPGIAAALILVLIGMVLVAGVVAISSANRTLAQLAAVAPQGWNRYEKADGETRDDLPLTLISPDLPGSFRQVSYPDAVRLDFDEEPEPGAVAGLVRRLKGLEIGKHYYFYLQVYDPGIAGDPNERLKVTLNRKEVWEREPGTSEEAGWTPIFIEWVADDRLVTIRVERTASQSPSSDVTAIPLVRNLHLYPEY
jgi:4-amino-4-deoxy-L-arabinose transferase-like glycosyltransferase